MSTGKRRPDRTLNLVSSDETERTRGNDALQSNIAAGKAVSDVLRTTLGPGGMDKMVVNSRGEIVVTSDGATVLDELTIEHPAAKIIAGVAETQKTTAGDGTTTAVVLTGGLLARAEKLHEKGLHPTTIIAGYHEASHIASDALAELSTHHSLNDERLTQVATSAIGNETGVASSEYLAERVVEAVNRVRNGDAVDPEDIYIQTKIGRSSDATDLVNGIIVTEQPQNDDIPRDVDRTDPVNFEMPRAVEDATVAVLDFGLDVDRTSQDLKYTVESADQFDEIIAGEDNHMRRYADRIIDAGVDAVFSRRELDKRLASHLASAGILAFDNLNQNAANAVVNATNGERLKSIDGLEREHLGHADRVTLRRYGTEDLAFVKPTDVEAVTIFVRGGTEHVTTRLEQSLSNAVEAVVGSIQGEGVIPGAGAAEIALAKEIRETASGIPGREQLAVEAFADTLELIPKTLAQNTGLDPVDTLIELRSRHGADEIVGVINDGRESRIADPHQAGILDAVVIKQEAIETASAAAGQLVRIDDIISAS